MLSWTGAGLPGRRGSRAVSVMRGSVADMTAPGTAPPQPLPPGGELVVLGCPGCEADSEFVTPQCAEHGADCPELACVACGWALVGPFEVAAVAPRAGVRRAALPA